MKSLDARYMYLLLDVLDQGIFTVDRNTHITFFNQTAEEITGFRAEEVIGKPCSQVFRTNLCEKVCPLRLSIKARTPIRNREVFIKDKSGRPVLISVSTAPLITDEGELLGGVEVFRDMSAIADLKRRLSDRYRLEDIIGKSRAMQRVFELLPLVAQSDSTLMVTGDSGTGKELVSKTVHALGPRADKPFVPVNCAAIPETLLESELFGYKRGAFTGAGMDKPGRIASAEGGTLFFDEVGDLAPAVQVKVLRFLQDRFYEPLGTNEPTRADVRVIAATNKDLKALIHQKKFREDLFYRLNVIQIDIPPLRDRPEDIPLLIDHFMRVNRASTGKRIEGLTTDAMARLIGYHFRGNVRELENIIERGFILCQGDRMTTEHLPELQSDQNFQNSQNSQNKQKTQKKRPSEPNSMISAEKRMIREALDRHNGNRTHAARELGIHRTTLNRKLKRYDMT